MADNGAFSLDEQLQIAERYLCELLAEVLRERGGAHFILEHGRKIAVETASVEVMRMRNTLGRGRGKPYEEVVRERDEAIDRYDKLRVIFLGAYNGMDSAVKQMAVLDRTDERRREQDLIVRMTEEAERTVAAVENPVSDPLALINDAGGYITPEAQAALDEGMAKRKERLRQDRLAKERARLDVLEVETSEGRRRIKQILVRSPDLGEEIKSRWPGVFGN